jgi:RNA polymerase sigma-70 factor (ECF subfamily)
MARHTLAFSTLTPDYQMENRSNELTTLIWRIILKDDKEALKKIFLDFFAPLCVYANRFIPDKDTCEDIVQNVFYLIWLNRKTLEITSSARNFLITSVKNSCIDYLRRKDVEARYIGRQMEKAEESCDTEELYTVSELEEALHNALSKLPDHIRTVFEMNRFTGLTYKEIAEKNGISEKTVEAYISKVLKFLRVELKDYLS